MRTKIKLYHTKDKKVQEEIKKTLEENNVILHNNCVIGVIEKVYMSDDGVYATVNIKEGN